MELKSIRITAPSDSNMILGVIDGEKPKGTENAADKEERRSFLRNIGYKR